MSAMIASKVLLNVSLLALEKSQDPKANKNSFFECTSKIKIHIQNTMTVLNPDIAM